MDYPTLTLLVARKRNARLEDACASVHKPKQPGRRHRIWCPSAARSQNTTAWYVVRVKPSGRPTLHESWNTRDAYESGRMLQQHGGRISAGSGAIKHMETKYFWPQQKEKNQELRIEKIPGTVDPADLMTKHLDGKRLMMLCDLLNIKHIGGRPSSAPKLTIATEYISRASRAQGALTLVKQAAAKENRCHSGAERETWIHGYSDD